jgi:hypothetical protein|tara:strand:+ start:103 stop:246 length:144 start_codon:yes stop_codon:yes gene_type:complete
MEVSSGCDSDATAATAEPNAYGPTSSTAVACKPAVAPTTAPAAVAGG